MKYGLWSLLSGVVLVSILVAQVPTPTEPSRTEGAQPPAKAQTPAGDRGTPFRPGFGTRGAPQLPPGSERSTVPPDRGSVGLNPGLAAPANFRPLPEPGAPGKMLMRDILFPQTAETLSQPTAAVLLDLARTGKLKGNARIRLLTLENVPSFTQF